MIYPLSKKTFTALIFLFLISYYGYSQGYAIHLTLKPFSNSKVYLGYHYGKVKAVAELAEYFAVIHKVDLIAQGPKRVVSRAKRSRC